MYQTVSSFAILLPARDLKIFKISYLYFPTITSSKLAKSFRKLIYLKNNTSEIIVNNIGSLSLVESGLFEVRIGPPAILHPLDNPPPGVLVLRQDLGVVGGRFDGSLRQIVGCLDCVDKLPGCIVLLIVLPADHRLLLPVVVHLDDGEELQDSSVVQLSLRTNLGELWLPEFLSLGVLLLLLEGKELGCHPRLDVQVNLLGEQCHGDGEVRQVPEVALKSLQGFVPNNFIHISGTSAASCEV